MSKARASSLQESLCAVGLKHKVSREETWASSSHQASVPAHSKGTYTSHLQQKICLNSAPQHWHQCFRLFHDLCRHWLGWELKPVSRSLGGIFCKLAQTHLQKLQSLSQGLFLNTFRKGLQTAFWFSLAFAELGVSSGLFFPVDPTGHPQWPANMIPNTFCLSFTSLNLARNSLVFLQWKKPCNHNCSLLNTWLSQKSALINNQDNSFECIQIMQVHFTTTISCSLFFELINIFQQIVC